MTTTRAGSETGSLRSNTASTTVNVAVVNAMPSASVTTATNVEDGLRTSIRAPYITSRHSELTCTPPTASFVTKRFERIDFRRAACRHVAREKRRKQQANRNSAERQ